MDATQSVIRRFRVGTGRTRPANPEDPPVSPRICPSAHAVCMTSADACNAPRVPTGCSRTLGSFLSSDPSGTQVWQRTTSTRTLRITVITRCTSQDVPICLSERIDSISAISTTVGMRFVKPRSTTANRTGATTARASATQPDPARDQNALPARIRGRCGVDASCPTSSIEPARSRPPGFEFAIARTGSIFPIRRMWGLGTTLGPSLNRTLIDDRDTSE
jgi:hypothetical protein